MKREHKAQGLDSCLRVDDFINLEPQPLLPSSRSKSTRNHSHSHSHSSKRSKKKNRHRDSKADDAQEPDSGDGDGGGGLTLDSPISCLQEAIFVMELEEDSVSGKEDCIPDIRDKVVFYQALLLAKHRKQDALLRLAQAGISQRARRLKSAATTSRDISYRGTVPEWAKPRPGEPPLYSSDDAADTVRLPKAYRFSYSPVPLPSIQNTLQKFVNI